MMNLHDLSIMTIPAVVALSGGVLAAYWSPSQQVRSLERDPYQPADLAMIALLADFFLRFTFWGGMGGGRRSSSSSSSGSDSGGGIQVIVFFVAIVLAILAPIAARLVQLAVSRQREYLADASSVDLTRNPQGLETALMKIAADPDPLEVANRATQHLYVVNPMKKLSDRGSALFSTHPPILDRVNRLRAMNGQPPLDAAQVQALRGLE